MTTITQTLPPEYTTTQELLQPSSYLQYLPALYWKDMFLGRFLRIFEDVLSPVQGVVNGLPDQFDPAVSSPSMLDLMAEWVGTEGPPGIGAIAWRRLVRSGMELHRWRGTKRGLRMALEIVTGHRPFITEFSQGLVLGNDASLGLNTGLQSGIPLTFHVAFACRESEVDAVVLRDTIHRYKPAHVLYTLSFSDEG